MVLKLGNEFALRGKEIVSSGLSCSLHWLPILTLLKMPVTPTYLPLLSAMRIFDFIVANGTGGSELGDSEGRCS